MGSAQPESPIPTVRYATTRFGEIEVAEQEILHFPEGLLGFSQCTDYVILKDPEQDPFLWMQSTQNPELAFVVVDPFLFFPGYEIQVKPHELSTIQLEDVRKATVLTILTIPDNPLDLTANLRGPLVINLEKNLAKQLVLIDDRYTTRHLLLRDLPAYLADGNPEPGDGQTGMDDAGTSSPLPAGAGGANRENPPGGRKPKTRKP